MTCFGVQGLSVCLSLSLSHTHTQFFLFIIIHLNLLASENCFKVNPTQFIFNQGIVKLIL